MAEVLGILLISGGYERAHYAFVTASAAAAIGREVVLFATNSGCRALLADLSTFAVDDDSTIATGVAGLAELRAASVELGVRLIACESGLRLAGIEAGLLEGVEIAGIVTFLQATTGAQTMTL